MKFYKQYHDQKQPMEISEAMVIENLKTCYDPVDPLMEQLKASVWTKDRPIRLLFCHVWAENDRETTTPKTSKK